MILSPQDPDEFERLKMVILNFVGEHPGCSRTEIEEHVKAHGGIVVDTPAWTPNWG